MCLYTRQLEPDITKRNILVWKEIDPRSTEDGWIPPIYETAEPLEYNKVLIPKNLRTQEDIDYLHIRSNYDSTGDPFLYIIEEGFHAYTEKPKHFKKRIYRRAIIPKGSEYCKGVRSSFGEIVASKMIIFKSFWDYIKWRLFR